MPHRCMRTGLMLLTACLSFYLVPAAMAQTYRLLPEAGEVTFEIGVLFMDISGDFRDYHGTVILRDGALAAVEAEIRCRSVNLPDREREQTVRSPEFLACGKNPLIRFESTRIVSDPPDRYRVTGDLTLVGTTRPVTLTGWLQAAEGRHPGSRYRFRATADVHWEDWGIEAMQGASGKSLVLDDLLHLAIRGILVPDDSE